MNRILTQISCELAATPSEHRSGLMNRRNLPPGTGMLFRFDAPDILSFWGRNTLIPLDIAFIDENGIIESIGAISPQSRNTIRSNGPCLYALEVSRGTFDEHGVQIGNFVQMENNKYGVDVSIYETSEKNLRENTLKSLKTLLRQKLIEKQLYSNNARIEQLNPNNTVNKTEEPEYSPEDPNWPSWIPIFPPEFIGNGADIWIFNPRNGLWYHILYTGYDTIIIKDEIPFGFPPGGHLYWRPGMDEPRFHWPIIDNDNSYSTEINSPSSTQTLKPNLNTSQIVDTKID